MRADANDITCRLLKESDAPQVRALWEYCFKDTKEFVELYFQKCFRAENTVGAYRGEKLLAAAQLNPYTLNLRGQKIPVSYIVGVETTPEERGSGAAGALMRELLTQSAERGCYLTLLMPFFEQILSGVWLELCVCALALPNKFGGIKATGYGLRRNRAGISDGKNRGFNSVLSDFRRKI